MPAGRGKECEACYWKKLLDKRTDINCAAFKVRTMAEYFRSFAIWLGRDVSVHKAAIILNRYLPFFIEIERRYGTIPNYDNLLDNFGAAELRKVVLPMRWMAEAMLITPNAKSREYNTEKRRIDALLIKSPQMSKSAKLLNGYYQILLADLGQNKTTIRSIRLSLSPAVALCQLCNEKGLTLPTQSSLDAFLDKSPGQRAALSGFVNYLRNAHEITIAVPTRDLKKAKNKRMNKLRDEMLELMRVGGDDEAFRRRWLSVSLAYFHGLPKKVGKAVTDENILDLNDGGVTIVWNGLRYWIGNG
jgi:hypothetical protein